MRPPRLRLSVFPQHRAGHIKHKKVHAPAPSDKQSFWLIVNIAHGVSSSKVIPLIKISVTVYFHFTRFIPRYWLCSAFPSIGVYIINHTARCQWQRHGPKRRHGRSCSTVEKAMVGKNKNSHHRRRRRRRYLPSEIIDTILESLQ